MKKKNDKIKILLIAILIYFVMSWIMEGGMYSSGEYASVGMQRMGLFDIILVAYSAFMRVLPDIIYILCIGGFYGVLSQTKGYRKLVDKTVKLIKGKELIAFGVITLLMGAYTSITSQILALFCVVPFIITVFLKSGYSRLTAISAGFGGMFIGYLGLTVGTYGVTYLNDMTGLSVTDWLGNKIILFVIAYVLFNVFGMLYMKKHKKVDETKYDMFYAEELDETKIKKKKQAKVWPTITIIVLMILVIGLGYISWSESFGIKVFDTLHTSIYSGFKIADIPIFGSLIGTYMKAFGDWNDLLFGTFIVVVATGLLALVNKVNIDTMFSNYGTGMRRISRLAIIYGLAISLAFFAASYPWPNNIVNTLFGSGSFNIFIILVIAILAQIMLVDPDCFSEMYGSFLSITFTENIVAVGVLWRLGSGIAYLVGPTSFLLLMALTYLDVSYKDWIKYIWKFALAFLIVALLALTLIIYV